MPVFLYKCLECDNEFEKIVIPSQSNMGEADQCPECRSQIIEKVITAPALVKMDGKAGLRTIPDPKAPLQALKEKGPREGCTGGYDDLPEFNPKERKKNKEGNWEWRERDRKIFDLG